VGLALIGGLFSWMNRRGGWTKRRKGELNQQNYSIDMTPNDFTVTPAAAAVAANQAESMSPFDHSRRFVPPTAYDKDGYMTENGYSDSYDLQQSYDQGYDFNQGYNINQTYDNAANYDHYNGYNEPYYTAAGYDSNRHEIHEDISTQTGISSPTVNEWHEQYKPNLRDSSNKPNEL
jgi:hypothetical protein